MIRFKLQPMFSKYSLIVVVSISIIIVNLFIAMGKNDSKPKAESTQVLSTYFSNSIINGITTVTSNSPVEFEVNYNYTGDEKKEFFMYIYWNYEQTEFSLNGERYLKYSFLADRKSNSYKFNVKLDKKFINSVNKMMVVIDDKNEDNVPHTDMRIQDVYTFVSSDKTYGKASFNVKTPYKTYETGGPNLYIINNDFNNNIETYVSAKQFKNNKTMEVKASTELELALRLSNFVGSGEQLVLIELNNSQIPINNEPYVIYKLNAIDGIIYDKIRIKVPDEPGEYNLNGTLVPNPFDNKRSINHGTLLNYKLVVT